MLHTAENMEIIYLPKKEQFAVEKTKKRTLQFKKGEEYSVKVVGISDGDTFTGLTNDNQQITV